MKSILIILLSSILVNNFVMSKFLGICPFLGVSKKVETALGMGMAVTFVMTMASLFTYLIQKLVLVPLGWHSRPGGLSGNGRPTAGNGHGRDRMTIHVLKF